MTAHYVWAIGSEIDPMDTIGPSAYARWAEIAEEWLTEHEPADISIRVREAFDGETEGVYVDGERLRAVRTLDDHAEGLFELTNRAWEAAWIKISAELEL